MLTHPLNHPDTFLLFLMVSLVTLPLRQPSIQLFVRNSNETVWPITFKSFKNLIKTHRNAWSKFQPIWGIFDHFVDIYKTNFGPFFLIHKVQENYQTLVTTLEFIQIVIASLEFSPGQQLSSEKIQSFPAVISNFGVFLGPAPLPTFTIIQQNLNFAHRCLLPVNSSRCII